MIEAKPSLSLKLLLPLLASIIAMTPLAIDMYLPAMPLIATDLSTEMPLMQNSISIYLLGYALGLLFFGPMSDKYSRRTLVFIGVCGFLLSTIALTLVNNIEQFLFVRFMQAFMASAATVIVSGTIVEFYGKDTSKGLSYVSMIMMLAPMIAPAIGSILLIHSWHMIFYVLAMYSFIVLLLSYKFLPEVKRKHTLESISSLKRYQIVFSHSKARLDILSAMMSSVAFFGYITAISFVYLKVFNVSEFTFSLLFGVNVFALMTSHFINSKCVVKKGSRRMLRYGVAVGVMASSSLVIVNLLDLGVFYHVIAIFPLMGSLSMISVNSDALILQEFTEQPGTASAVIGTLRFGIGGLGGPILAVFFDASATPFVMFMWLSVLSVCVFQLIHYVKYK